MSHSIVTIARTSLSSVTPELLYEGIAGRLDEVARTYAAGDDDTPQQVLARLQITREGAEPFGEWQLRYAASGRAISIERAVGKAWEPTRRALFDEVGQDGDPIHVRLRGLLSEAKECVTFELSASDARGMGWAVAMAAAAALARASDGIVRAEGEGWLEPKGKSVALLLSLRG